MIVLVIVSMLSIVLFRVYSSVSEIAFRLQQEKYVMQDSLAFSQILQNFADTAKIDYPRYGTTIRSTSGLTDTLYLHDAEWSFSIFSTWNCVSPAITITGFTVQQRQNPCHLALLRSWSTLLSLSDTGHVFVSRVMFKIIPFEDPDLILSWTQSTTTPVFLRIHQPGFWLFMRAYSPRFWSEWIRNVSLSLQQFFTLKP